MSLPFYYYFVITFTLTNAVLADDDTASTIMTPLDLDVDHTISRIAIKCFYKNLLVDNIHYLYSHIYIHIIIS